MTEIEIHRQKCISDRLQELLPQLSRDQLRFVTAMQEHQTKGEAAKAIGLKPHTVYGWPAIVDEVISLVAQDAVETAKQIAVQNLVKAMMVKVAGLDSKDEATRQKVATELVEWSLGKATQKTELGGSVEITTKGYTQVSPDDWPGESE